MAAIVFMKNNGRINIPFEGQRLNSLTLVETDLDQEHPPRLEISMRLRNDGADVIKTVRAAVEAIDEDAWQSIDYPGSVRRSV